MWLIMEHCVGGSILDVVKRTKMHILPELLLKGVTSYTLLAVAFLHSNRVIHRVRCFYLVNICPIIAITRTLRLPTLS